MAAGYRLAALRDFTGGLNLRADQFQLAANESPDLLNLDIDPRGGVRLRKAMTPHITTDLLSTGTSGGRMWEYTTASGARYLVIEGGYNTGGSGLSTSQGGAFSTLTQFTNLNTINCATFNNTFYAVGGTGTLVNAPKKWDGTTVTALTQTFNDNLAAPTNGNMPFAQMIAAWGGYLWIAHTREAATEFPNRVRWSHPNKPEDWRNNDYIDVAMGEDGDQITAIVPDGDRLLVFKKHSIHAIYGSDAESYFVQTLTHSVGTPTVDSVVNTPNGVYVWHPSEGVYLVRGNSVTYLYERLRPELDAMSQAVFPVLKWMDHKLWVRFSGNTISSGGGVGGGGLSGGLPIYGAGSTTMYVLDPTLGKGGVWTRYLYPVNITQMFEWHQPASIPLSNNEDVIPLAVTDNGGSHARVARLDSTVTFDSWTGGSNTHIGSYYTTAWIDGGMPSIKKRWSKTRTLAYADQNGTVLPFRVYVDYDINQPKRTSSITTGTTAGTAVWDTAVWDTAIWGLAAGTAYDIEKNVGGGTATAVQYRIEGPTSNNRWGFDALVLTYRPKKVR